MYRKSGVDGLCPAIIFSAASVNNSVL